MLCVSIAEKGFDETIKAIENEQLCEIRLDLIPLSEQEIARLFASPVKLVATFRPDNVNNEHRKKILKKAIESGAAYVDLEIENDKEFNIEMIAFARTHNCKIIISYHNYTETPDNNTLHNLVEECYRQGAEIAKIACMANHRTDCARLLNLYTDNRQKIVIGMGEEGKITRIAAPLLGAPFTFTSQNARQATAPGQITKHTAETIYQLLKNQ